MKTDPETSLMSQSAPSGTRTGEICLSAEGPKRLLSIEMVLEIS
jgi:hypothetical protein